MRDYLTYGNFLVMNVIVSNMSLRGGILACAIADEEKNLLFDSPIRTCTYLSIIKLNS